MLVYSLTSIFKISSDGFDFSMPDITISTINNLSSQVGSPTYIKTPNFHKEAIKIPPPGYSFANNGSNGSNGCGGGFSGGGGGGGSSGGGFAGGGGGGDDGYRKKRRGNTEIVNNDEWENLRTFQPTKIEQKNGIIDQIRLALNKMSDKNYKEHFAQIFELLSTVTSPEEMQLVGISIFEIASNNRFYSKLYADLYGQLIHKYEFMNTIVEENFNKFLELFMHIEYVDSNKDYTKFCKINKDNEMRKALGAFFVNLTHNNIISYEKLFGLTHDLLEQLLSLIEQPGKTNEVDEISENISILYNSKLFKTCTLQISGKTIQEYIVIISKSKAKSSPSLTSKTIFKFMDLLES
jgi:hypothetical protein